MKEITETERQIFLGCRNHCPNDQEARDLFAFGWARTHEQWTDPEPANLWPWGSRMSKPLTIDQKAYRAKITTDAGILQFCADINAVRQGEERFDEIREVIDAAFK